MADINVTVTVPSVITATATDPNHITVAVTNPAPITVSASVGNVGDMMKSVYDTDNSGVVDNAAALGGVSALGFVQTADTSWIELTDGGATALHSHSAGAGTVTSIATTAPITGGTITDSGTIGISAATTSAAGSMSASDKSKLDGIASGAQVNNISDVNATDLTDGGSTNLHSHANDHARQHSITSTSDHTSTATSGQMLKADANGLPVNATNTDAQVSAAVTASHTAVTVADTASIDLTLSGQQVSAAAIFGTGAGVVAEGNHTHTGVYEPADATIVKTGNANWIDLTDGGATTLHSHASPALVTPSVADNFVSFADVAGAQKDSGKGLTHLVYTLQTATSGLISPGDGAVFRFGSTWGSVNVLNGITIPMAGTIVYASFIVNVLTATGSAETSTVYIRHNDTTDIVISSDVKADAAYQSFYSDLNIAVAKNDFIEWKWVCPTWASNPTGVRVMGVALIQV